MVEGRREVFPARVYFLNKRDFLGSRPAFQLFFARDGRFDVGEEFLINEIVRLVFFAEAIADAVFCAPRRDRGDRS